MDPIRYIFPSSILAMWIVGALGLSNGEWTASHWVVLGLAHLACAIIFANFVAVFSYGYGTSMIISSLAIMLWRPGGPILLVGGLGMLYGLRLIRFIYVRYRSEGYAPIRAKGELANATVVLPLRVFMWIGCGWLMGFLAMPALIAASHAEFRAGTVIGAGLMLLGLVLETVADHQKQSAKARRPDAFVSSGLYSRIRHPNYFGEMIFQFGLVVVALNAATTDWQLALGTVGPFYMLILMYWATRDQEARQGARYGHDRHFQAYRQRSGLFFPRI